MAQLAEVKELLVKADEGLKSLAEKIGGEEHHLRENEESHKLLEARITEQDLEIVEMTTKIDRPKEEIAQCAVELETLQAETIELEEQRDELAQQEFGDS